MRNKSKYDYIKLDKNYQKQGKYIFIYDSKCHMLDFRLAAKSAFSGRQYENENEQKEWNVCGWFRVAQHLQKLDEF